MSNAFVTNKAVMEVTSWTDCPWMKDNKEVEEPSSLKLTQWSAKHLARQAGSKPALAFAELGCQWHCRWVRYSRSEPSPISKELERASCILYI